VATPSERFGGVGAPPTARTLRGGRSPPSPPRRGGSRDRSAKRGARTSEASAGVAGAAHARAATAAKAKPAQRAKRAEVHLGTGQPTGWRSRAAPPRHGAPSSAMRLRDRAPSCTFAAVLVPVLGNRPNGPICDCSATRRVAAVSARQRQIFEGMYPHPRQEAAP
jgi:hypothetical protein